MTGSESPAHLDVLSIPELMDELIELEAMASEIVAEIAGIRSELKERVTRDEPYDHIVKVDDENRAGMTIRVSRQRGPGSWKYNPQWVTNKMEELEITGYMKKALDTKTFNSALKNNEELRAKFQEHVRWERGPDKLQIKGFKEVLEHRGTK